MSSTTEINQTRRKWIVTTKKKNERERERGREGSDVVVRKQRERK
jgi:hypothetical protein